MMRQKIQAAVDAIIEGWFSLIEAEGVVVGMIFWRLKRALVEM
jgi:hypothetical protein